MRFIGRLLRRVITLWIVVAIASMIGALALRGRLASTGGPEDDELDLVAILDAADMASTARSLRRVTALAWYGGGSLDLRAATLDPAGARLEVRSIFGGFRLVVPPEWRVETRGIGIFGGFGDGRRADLVDPNGPLVVLEGFSLFGGVGIVSEAPDLTVASLPD